MSLDFICSEDTYNYVKKRCMDEGCRLKIGKGLVCHYVFDIEKYVKDNYPEKKTTDCLIICIWKEHKIIAVIELKNNSFDVDKIKHKFESIFEIVGDFIDVNSLNEYLKVPILLSKSLNGEYTKILDRTKIDIDDKKYPIIKEKCNSSLTTILKNYYD